MAAEPKALFTVDAGQILAKLHLAGQQQVTLGWIVNTAIQNPTDNADPTNPGKTKFDFSSKNGSYEVVYCRSDFSYQLPIDVSLNKAIGPIEEELKKTAEEAEKKPLTGDAGKKSSEEAQKKKEQLFAEYQKYKLQKKIEEGKDIDESLNNAREAIKEENKLREEAKAKKLEEFKTEATAQLKNYFKSFAGKEAESKATAENAVSGILSLDGKKVKGPTNVGKDFIKDFQLSFMDEKKIKEESKKLQASKPDDFVEAAIGFRVGYSVDVNSL